MWDKFISRRSFLTTMAGLGSGLLFWPLIKPWLPSQNASLFRMHGSSPSSAHGILSKDFPEPVSTLHTPVVIVGSGIAGLSAARYLYRHGIHDFKMLELEPLIGGNSSWGENAASPYPWAAHYLPILSTESDFLTEFLKEENIITGFNEKGEPFYNELYLCHDLKERLYLNGTWQDGLVPQHGIPESAHFEIHRFFKLMEEYKYKKGTDNKFAFCIPIAMSSQDPALLNLDTITMKAFLKQHDFHSEYLYWYVNYCCRDDFGAGSDEISAWAGIHYFASRRSKSANSEQDAILTWPQGNGFLAQRLCKEYIANIHTQSLVYQILPQGNRLAVNYYDLNRQMSFRIIANAVVMATPRFIAHKICDDSFKDCFLDIKEFAYSPWLVANIHLSHIPSGRGAPLAWDNVSYYSRSLGYIDGQHQSLQSHPKEYSVTYYLPLDEDKPTNARKHALNQKAEFWQKHITQDLERIHPGIKDYIRQIDFRILGHAMIRPTPHTIWQKSQILPRQQAGLFFAHSDMSGISIFEEAFWQGITSGKEVIHFLQNA